MSEYQYYEFQAIDRPLTDQEINKVRSLSSRATVTPRQAIFTYSYSDFRGDALSVLATYFDAMLYIANFGVKQLSFRLPKNLVDVDQLSQYAVPYIITIKSTEHYVVLDIHLSHEGGYGWIEENDSLSELISLRHDLLQGDYRMLYLAWLAGIHQEEFCIKEEVLEPPVPVNLKNLTDPLKCFIDFFEIDEDLVEVAAAESPTESILDQTQLSQKISMLSIAERDEFLIKLLNSEANVDVQLARRLKEINNEKISSAAGARTVQQLLENSEKRAKEKSEQKALAAKKARIEQLKELAKKEPQIWTEVFQLIETKNKKSYELAVKSLKDLKAVAEHMNSEDIFNNRLNEIRQRFKGLSSLIRQLDSVNWS
jgi:hypothetical protein